jgi:hypothetical protein
MKISSFKEVLIKKADGNNSLVSLIQNMETESLLTGVLEALEKMARPSAALGRGANSALTSYAAHMDNSDVEQLRDALGHHISHYKGALKAMHAAPAEQKKQLRQVADQHLSKIIPMMHLAGRAGQHSNNKLSMDYVSTVPWESNYTTTHRHDHNGKLKEGTKDLGRRPNAGANRQKNIRAVPDYHYLEMPPHPGHADSSRMTHKGGYPFEELQVGSPSKIDAKQAFLPIEDVQGKTAFEPHPFDKHPVHTMADIPESHLTDDQKQKFAQDLASWKTGEHHQKWLNDQKEKFKKDPEAYKKRGQSKPAHHYEGLPLMPQPDHVKEGLAPASDTTQSTEPSAAAPAVQPTQSQSKAVSPDSSVNSTAADVYAKASPEIRKILERIPEFAAIARANAGKK